MKKIIPIVLSLALLGVGSCKKFEETVNKAATKGSLSATVNGRTYNAGNVAVTVTDKAFIVGGSQLSDEESLELFINKYKGPGKYTIDHIYNTAKYYDSKSHSSVYGEIEIISTGEKSAKGTFYFQTNDSLMVTDGKFDVKWE
ncbi:hypothetical protein CAP35_07220 [Chitinophagaceae bacterium IBVUCB1]|nr:hypothetical protein CAP35_07220 [Chitinophagaceae bacterium IBVUCB1]